MALSILLLSVAIREWQDNRPIKFEAYNEETFLDGLRLAFPLGSDVDKAIELLVNSGARIVKIGKVKNAGIEGTKLNAQYIIRLEYYSPILSLNPNARYSIYFEIDENRKIIKVVGSRSSFMEGFII